MRIIRTKPFMLVSAGALTKKLMDARSRRRRKSRMGKGITGLLATGAIGGAIKYFTDVVDGPGRRDKIKSMFGKVRHRDPDWSTEDQNRFKIAETTPAES